MRDHFFQRQLVAHPQPQGELPVVVAGLDAQQGRSHRQHRDGRAAGSQPPQPDRTRLQDLGMRGELLQR